MSIVNFYPFFWALCVIVAAFGAVMLDIMIEDFGIVVSKRRMRLRDKAHFAMTQNRGFA